MFSKFNLIFAVFIFTMSCNDTATSPEEPKDDEKPLTSIINPLSNTEWDEGTVITIKATASDNEGISKVEFYIDGNLEFTDDSVEYYYVWNTDNKSGSHTLMTKAYDINNNTGSSDLIYVKIINETPQASFTVSPSSGDTTIVFKVDASASSDKEDDAAELQIRWDWEADGSWDTDYSTLKTAEHKYSTDGTKRILLEVKDTDGQTDTTSLQILVDSADPGTVTDIDGNVYHTVKIGNQWWIVENLRVTHYRDGTAIPLVYINSQWVTQNKGAYCYYNMDASNITDYGLMYNFHAVSSDRGLAPEGWHVASDEEWKELEMYLGMTQGQADLTLWRGTNEGGKLKESGTTHWNAPNTGATNETGFTALPGGWRSMYDGTFSGMGTFVSFWTSTGTTASNGTYALTRGLSSAESRISRTGDLRVAGLSVRCIKD